MKSMSTGRWDANAWHRQARRRYEGPVEIGRRRGIPKILAVTAILGMGLASAAVANWNGPATTEYLGICHATGSEASPYVLLVVPLNGFEHGHHRHHDGDYFVDPASPGCLGTVPAPTPDVPQEDEPTEPEDPHDGNVTPPPEEPGVPDDNETPDEAEPQPEPAPNENGTVPEEPELTPPGDATLSQSAVQDEFEVTLTFTVSSVGEGASLDVTLEDTLPEVRRPWYLGGADASRCVLDGRSLQCWFGDLDPGASRTVRLEAYTDRLPCGQTLTNTAWVSSEGDPEPRNNGSSASIAARAC